MKIFINDNEARRQNRAEVEIKEDSLLRFESPKIGRVLIMFAADGSLLIQKSEKNKPAANDLLSITVVSGYTVTVQ